MDHNERVDISFSIEKEHGSNSDKRCIKGDTAAEMINERLSPENPNKEECFMQSSTKSLPILCKNSPSDEDLEASNIIHDIKNEVSTEEAEELLSSNIKALDEGNELINNAISPSTISPVKSVRIDSPPGIMSNAFVSNDSGDINILGSVASDNPKKFQKNASYCGTGRLPCPSLGQDWTIEQIVRQQGKSAGRYDTYYYSPSGAKIRSKLKLRECIDVDLTHFDYNSGKFIESENAGIIASPKSKMCHLKTDELKTIDRSVDSSINVPTASSNKQSKKLTIKLPPRKKELNGACSNAVDRKKHFKKAKKRKLAPTLLVRNAIDLIDDDSTQNNPFEAFKFQALGLSSHFSDMKDYEDLIQFAWNFLSIESKTRFNDIITTDSPMKTAISSNVPDGVKKPCPIDCICSSCKNLTRPAKFRTLSGPSFQINSSSDPLIMLRHNQQGYETFSPHILSDGAISMVARKSVVQGNTVTDKNISHFGGTAAMALQIDAEHPLSHTLSIDSTDIEGLLQQATTNAVPVLDSLVKSVDSSLTQHNSNNNSVCDITMMNTEESASSTGNDQCFSKQKPHKRKSRVPVYIKQD